MGRIIGIDLGTTNTAIAVLENGKPRVLADERGYRVLPSVVASKGEGRFVVGQAASSLMLTRPDRTVYAVKRLIGRRFDAPEVAEVARRVHYPVRAAADGGVEVCIDKQWYSPQQVSAVVLQVARSIAEKALGDTVDEAVITVPAYFNHAQRAATLEAARLAGLRCERLLNEPTAAALAYGHRKNVDRRLVVFDLGGGTFDVSVLRVKDGIYEILATGGDTFLGGEDFDYALVDEVSAAHLAAKGYDPRKDAETLQRVKDACERAKCELSFAERADVSVPHVGPGHTLEHSLTRARVEQLNQGLVERCIRAVGDAVTAAGLRVDDIDDVLLVGGMTRMPAVRDAVHALFHREPNRSVHPEEAVATGAAIHAGSLEDAEAPRAVLLDVTPFDLGIDAVGGTFSTVIPRNHRIPCSETRVFATAQDNQDSVRVCVRQGESRIAADNEFLGEFVFAGLPTGARLNTKIAVTFRIDANGVLHVSARDAATGEKRSMTIRNYADVARGAGVKADVEVDAPQQAAEAPKAPPAATPKMGLLDAIFGRRRPAKPTAPAAAKTPAAPATTTPAAAAPVQALTMGAKGPSVRANAPEAVVTASLVPLDEQIEDLSSQAAFVEEERAEIAEVLAEELDDASMALDGDIADALAEALAAADGVPPLDDDGLDVADLFGEAPEDAALSAVPLAEPTPARPVTIFDEDDEDDEDPPTAKPSAKPSARLSELADAASSVVDTPVGLARVDAAPLGDDLGIDLSSLFDDAAPAGEAAGAAAGFALLPDDAAGASGSAVSAHDAADASHEKRPATLRLHFHDHAKFVAEYRVNLAQNGLFIPTERPLAVGRACIFEVTTPSLDGPLVLRGVVTERLRDPRGMRIAYTLDDAAYAALESALA